MQLKTGPLQKFPEQWVALGLALVMALTLFSFWKALNGPFVFDDFPNLQNLEQIRGDITPRSVRHYLHAFNGNPGRPLSALSFLIEDHAWPSEPRAFKRTNLLLHCLMGLLLFLLARRLALELPRWAPHAQLIALAATAMWLLHPMQLSATMLVVQRMNILSMLCIVLGLLSYLRILSGPADAAEISGTRAFLALSVAAMFTLLAVLCKENGALLPTYALALNLTALRPLLARMRAFPRRLLLAGTALPLAMMVAGVALTHDSIFAAYSFRDFTLGERLLTQPRILFDYLGNILLPRLGGQGIFHDDYLISRSLWHPANTALALLGLAGAIAGAWLVRQRHPGLTFAVTWYLAGHVMESTVLPLELYFEHRNYLPMFGPLLALAGSALSLSGRYRSWARGSLAAWLLLAATLTAYNATIWGDRGKLALVWLEEQPQSVRAVQMAASYYADNGNVAAARSTLDSAIERIPQSGDLSFQRMLLDCVDHGLTAGQRAKLQTLATQSAYTRSTPQVIGAFIKQSLEGRCHGTMTPAEAERLALALTRNPAVARETEAIGYIYYDLAKIAEKDRDLDRLMHYLDESYRYRPSPFVPREQAIHLLTAGLPDDAMRYLRISDTTSQPWIKAKLVDMPRLNAPLWASARSMKRSLVQRQKSHDTARMDVGVDASHGIGDYREPSSLQPDDAL